MEKLSSTYIFLYKQFNRYIEFNFISIIYKEMPHMDEPYYCSEQIEIPPELPDILKQFTKAAIRTQPNDLLEWSSK